MPKKKLALDGLCGTAKAPGLKVSKADHRVLVKNPRMKMWGDVLESVKKA